MTIDTLRRNRKPKILKPLPPHMASGTRWNIVETRIVEERKSLDGVKCVNNYALLRTLGQGRFAKVKLCERIEPPRPEENKPPGAPPSMAPLRPTFASPSAAPSVPPRRQFAMKIFSKSSLSKVKEYVSPGSNVCHGDPGPPSHSGAMRVVTALDRVRDEVKIMRTLYHRNIVLLFEVIESEASDKIYLILEYMPTGPCMVFRPDTRDFVSPITKSVLSDSLARAHLLDILNGLQYLHDRGICHRDLKPDNVLLNATGRCHISDFGCALQKPVSSPVFVNDTVGTYQFLSPEGCSGEPYDPIQADVWAVGVILFIFLFGRLPFVGETTKDLFDRILGCDLLIPEDVRSVSAECRDLLTGLLAKDAHQRLSVADALKHPWLHASEDDEEPPSF